MKMELELEKDDCTIEINGTEHNGVLEATVEVDYTAGTSGSTRCGSSSYEDCDEAPSPATIEVEWAECTLTIFNTDGNVKQPELAVLKFFGVDFLQSLFGEIEEEHLDVDGLI